MLLAFSPVSDTDGWSIAIAAPKDDFMESTRQNATLTLIVLVIALAISVIVALRMATKIGKPMALCTKRLEQMAAGDFSTPVPKVRSRDETGRLANATESIVSALSAVIQDLVYTLSQMAKGNFDVALRNRDKMVGELSPIGAAMDTLIDQQNDALSQINAAAAIRKGVGIAEETAQTLETVVKGSQGIEVAINQIADHASKQFEETQQAAQNVEQISNIVQTNSATSEESAAASEELSGQSQMLKELVSHYKLRSGKGK